MSRTQSFGRYDGICILMTAMVIGSFFAPVSFFFADFFQGASALVAVAIGVGLLITVAATFLLIALLATADLWLLMGNAGLTQRLLLVFLINIAPCVVFLMGTTYAMARAGNQGDDAIFFGLLTQRLIVFVVLGVMSFILQAMNRWRLTGPVGPALSRRRSFQLSIIDIMMCTGVVAAFLGCTTYWISYAESPNMWSYFRFDSILWTVAGAASIEILGVLVFLLFPFVLSFGAPWIRRHFPGAVALWILFVGVIVSLLALFTLAFHNTSDAILAVWIFCGHIGFAIALFILLAIEKRTGFGVHVRLVIDTPARKSLSKVVPAGCICALLSISVIIARFDLPTLISTGSLSLARRVAWMSYEVGAFPDSLSGDWGLHRVKYGRAPSFLFTADGEGLARMIEVMVPRGQPVVLKLRTAGLSKVVLDQLQELSIGELSVTCNSIDTAAFREFCRTSDAKEIRITNRQLSAPQIEAVGELQKLKNVALVHTIRFNVENQRALVGLPKTQLSIQLDDDGLKDVSMLQGIKVLSICNSTITHDSIKQLGALGLERLVLEECDLDAEAVGKLAWLSLESLSWELPSPDRTQIAPESLFPLAASRSIQYVELVTPFDLLFRTKFVNRRGPRQCSVTSVAGSSEVDQYFEADARLPLFQRLIRESNGDAMTVLEQAATQIVRNASSSIVELDLQEVPLRGFPLDELPELDKVRRLRVGHISQSRRVFERISKLGSLRELEISGHRLDNRSLKKICQLSQLRRLQLPLSPSINYDECRTPERMPIFDQDPTFFTLPRNEQGIPFLDLDQLSQFLRLNAENWANDIEEGYYGSYGNSSISLAIGDPRGAPGETPIRGFITEDGFAALSKLKHLEHLFMPGYLLTGDTMDVLEDLPKLKQLHAVFSFVRPGVLERISKMKQLESLSIGLGSIDQRTIDRLSQLPNLRELQLVIFNTNLITNPVSAKQAQAALQRALPNCRIHLIHLHRD